MLNEGMEIVYIDGYARPMENRACPQAISDNFKVIIMGQGFFYFGNNRKEVWRRVENELENLLNGG